MHAHGLDTRGGAWERWCWPLTRVQAPSDDLSKLIHGLRQLLQLGVVQTQTAAASLYGKSIGGHHVAVLCKQSAESKLVTIDLKCGDEGMASCLVTEASQLFGGPK